MTQKTSKDFIPYEEALAIEKLGYDEDDFMAVWYYRLDGEALILDIPINDHSYMAERWLKIPALTYSQSFRWFRDNHKLVGFVEVGIEKGYYTYQVYNNNGNMQLGTTTLHFNYTYEEAELACLKKLIEIVKNK